MQTEKEKNRIPSVRKTSPIAMSANMEKFDEATDKAEFLREEAAHIADGLEKLPISDSYAEEREAVLEENAKLLDAVTDIYGFDAWTAARTRMQRLGGVMGKPTALMLVMAGAENSKLDPTGDKSFFTSRYISPDGRVQLNATSIVFVNGLPYTFSVLKRFGQDSFGEFGADFPALGVAREALVALKKWHEATSPGTPLEEDPLVNDMVELFNERVHDVLHAMFLYDTKALTKAFKSFADKIFFTKHLFKDPNKINYEFIVDRAFHKAWRRDFENNPEDKTDLEDRTRAFLGRLEDFNDFMKRDDPENADKITNYVGFIGIRGVVHKLPYNGEELAKIAEEHPRLNDILDLIPENHKEYLDGIYSDEFGQKVPWGDSGEELTFDEVFEKYIEGLETEFRMGIDMQSKNSAWLHGEDAIAAIKDIPGLVDKLHGMEPHKFSPDIFLEYGSMFHQLEEDYGPEVARFIESRIEIDEDNGFYLRLDRRDVDFDEGRPGMLLHSKKALLVQIPYDYPKDEIEIRVTRPKTLLLNEIGAAATARPGDFVILNIHDASLAKKLVQKATGEAGFDFDAFQKAVAEEVAQGKSSLGVADLYPYPQENAIDIFDLEAAGAIKRDEEGRVVLQAGHYKTKENLRQAFSVAGPVSMDSEDGDRRRIHQGAVVRNHIQKGIPLDYFPVDAWSFRRFYQGAARKNLPPIEVTSRFSSQLGMDKGKASKLIQEVLGKLEYINTLKVYGPRGEQKKVVFADIL